MSQSSSSADGQGDDHASANTSHSHSHSHGRGYGRNLVKKTLVALGYAVWTLFSFALAQALLYGAVYGLRLVGVSFATVNDTLFSTIYSAVVYLVTIAIVIGGPWLLRHKKTTLRELGLSQLPRWRDLLWVPAGIIAYLILTALITTLARYVLPFINFSESQDTGFTNLSSQFQYFLAFFTLVIVAPFAEEVIFRGYLFGKLRRVASTLVAALLASLTFAVAHMQWNVGLDVFALSLVLCLLRVGTDSLWPSILLHMLKNMMAFYLLFINTSLLSTLGG